MVHNKKNIQTKSGIAALVTVVIIGAAALLMAYSAALLGLGELELGYTTQRGSEAFSVTDGCLEETLRRIRLDTSYGVGVETIVVLVPNGSCSIVITDLGGSQRSIIVSGSTDDYYKSIEATILLSGNVITMQSWEEISS